MGGTCAVDLTVMHPDMFSAFEDIAGDLCAQLRHQGPRPIERLFGGNAAAYAPFDPTTVITRHGPYTRHHRMVRRQRPTGTAVATEQAAAANSLCALGSATGSTARW